MAGFYQDFTVGILGGGQLGRMLIQAATDWNVDIHILDPAENAPCAHLAKEFTQGALTDFDTVYEFGKKCDLITIEIENVNTQALQKLSDEGVKVFPQPKVISLIQDKRLQKQFYLEKGIPTAPFVLVENADDVRKHSYRLPTVNKLGRAGYDGRGVQVLRTEEDLAKGFDDPGILEDLIDFDKEISVIVARNEHREVSTFPAVEMAFHPTANLVEFLFSPAQIEDTIANQASEIAKKVITELDMVGLLAVEMFVTKDGQVLVNEVAPRPHNSGHQTIEANITSQYHQHLRSILGLPLGHTASRVPSAMVNLLGEDGHTGMARVEGLEEALAIPGVYVHLYGKKTTKPFRKMGHVTVVDTDEANLRKTARKVKDLIRIIA
ncbi:5-(carboxyamino)imidazole ribonucleotide synthase [Roseivirga sp. BDSF3-8]|uniref:5-(carboxyamino)imidazole ribonucleotide synthase n=1 Tax=Roseivirga sp. BDSF3-8 TaxID=3241598 RepID=UPI003531E2FB